MIFTSFKFLFLFLPIVFFGFFISSKFKYQKSTSLWLLISSFSFYAFWKPEDLMPLATSIAINYGIYKLFETEYGIVGNLDNYRDTNHYSRYVNDYMVYSFKNDKHLVTQSNLEVTHQKFLQLPKKDFITPLGKQDPLLSIYGRG